MKKIILSLFAILFFIALPINIFAVDFSFSVGGGGLVGYTFSRYTLGGTDIDSNQSMDRFNYGGFIFLDATYVEFCVMYQANNNSYKETMTYSGIPLSDSEGTGTEASIGFSLLGKYPFKINKKFTLFPMVGIEYQIALVQIRHPKGDLSDYDRSEGKLPEDMDKNGDPYPLSAWNSFWIDIGAGLDFYLTDSLFLRGELLFGIRLPTDYEMGALETIKKLLNVSDPTMAGLTGSPNFKLSIGYRF